MQGRLESGVHFGRFLLVRRLAVGGMAEIWLARPVEGSSKPVVLKRVLPQFASDPEFVARFREEASLTLHLVHGNIVPVFEIGSVGEDPFIVMEYVPGYDLRAMLRAAREKKMVAPPAVGAWIVSELLRGLDYAHRKSDEDGRPLGLVHRDVSPSNVVVSMEGTVKLLDFGIAKAIGRAEATRTGVLRGKLGYMSPEQARGERIGPQSDLFSTAVVLYELLTTQKLFDGESEPEIMERVKSAAIPRVRERNPDVPEALEGILSRALARDPEKRYTTAAEFLAALSGFLWSSQAHAGSSDTAKFVRTLFPEEASIESWEAGTGSLGVEATATQGAARPGAPALLLGGAREREPESGSGRSKPAPPSRSTASAGVLVTFLLIGLGAVALIAARPDLAGFFPGAAESRIPDGTGTLFVVSRNAPDARVLVDGVDTGRRTPALIEVEAGSRIVRIEHPEFQPLEKELVVRERETASLDSDLTPDERTLVVESTPPGALVSIDAKVAQVPCTTPCSFRRLSPAETVVLVASLQGHRRAEAHVRIADVDGPVSLSLAPLAAASTPAPLPPRAGGEGRVSFRVYPGWAWLSVDDGPESDRPLIDLLLPAGDHRLRIRADDGRFDLSCPFRLASGKRLVLDPLDATVPDPACPQPSGS